MDGTDYELSHHYGTSISATISGWRADLSERFEEIPFRAVATLTIRLLQVLEDSR